MPGRWDDGGVMVMGGWGGFLGVAILFGVLFF